MKDWFQEPPQISKSMGAQVPYMYKSHIHLIHSWLIHGGETCRYGQPTVHGMLRLGRAIEQHAGSFTVSLTQQFCLQKFTSLGNNHSKYKDLAIRMLYFKVKN